MSTLNLKTLLFILSLTPVFATAQSPGGAGTANLKLWNKANTGVSTSGSNVTAWTDQSGTNSFAVTGTPALQASALNYNPTILFNGSSRFTGNTSITNITQAFVVGKIVNNTGAAASGAMIGSNASTTQNFFFHTQSGMLYAHSGSSLSTGYTSPNTTPYSIWSEDLSLTPAVNDRIRLNGRFKNNERGGDLIVVSYTPVLGARSTENILNGSEMAEAIIFSTSLAAADVNKVESYLAIKYGITLDNTDGGNSGDYTSSSGATTWDADNKSAYHRQVIGIAHDDNSALLQKQSHTSDDTTRIYLSSLQTTNAANTGSFSADRSFVMIGNDGGLMERDQRTLSEFPPGQGIYRRLDREWKVTNTNFNGSFSLDMKLNTPYVTDIDIVLLVDDDGDFTNAQVFNPAVTYSGGVVTLSGITTTMIPANSTRYITIASINSRSALPVVLVDFTANVTTGKKVKLNWRTATEINSDYQYR